MYVSLRNKSNVYLESRCWCLNDLTYWCQLTNDAYIVISNNVLMVAKLMIIFYKQPDNDKIVKKIEYKSGRVVFEKQNIDLDFALR